MHTTNEENATWPDELSPEALDRATGGDGCTGIVVAADASAGAGGRGAGKVSMQDFHFVMK